MTNVANASPTRPRVLVLGASGTIGRSTVRALVRRGYLTVALVRSADARASLRADFAGAEVRAADVTGAAVLMRDGFRGERFDVLLSCLASRSGAQRDA